jgi:hypothetical protein
MQGRRCGSENLQLNFQGKRLTEIYKYANRLSSQIAQLHMCKYLVTSLSSHTN